MQVKSCKQLAEDKDGEMPGPGAELDRAPSACTATIILQSMGSERTLLVVQDFDLLYLSGGKSRLR
jgi:hypothetical protein